MILLQTWRRSPTVHERLGYRQAVRTDLAVCHPILGYRQSVHTDMVLRTFWQSRHQAQPCQSINLTVQPPGSSNVAIYEFGQTSYPAPAKYLRARINLYLTFIEKYLTIKRQLLSIKDLDYQWQPVHPSEHVPAVDFSLVVSHQVLI